MAIREGIAPVERLKTPPTDCLVQIGHSIVQTGVKEDTWQLSSLLQFVEELGIAQDGFKKFRRLGQAAPITSNSEHTIVGGGRLVTFATSTLFNKLTRQNTPPKTVIHCGGRPSYLDSAAPNQPDLTEARVMSEYFNKFVGDNPQKNNIIQLEISNTTNTEDDIRRSLEVALANQSRKVTFVCLALRVPRCQYFLEQIRKENPEKYEDFEIKFVTAESVLRNIAIEKNRLKEWEHFYTAFTQSPGYLRTVEAEQAGIAASQAGTYAYSSKKGQT